MHMHPKYSWTNNIRIALKTLFVYQFYKFLKGAALNLAQLIKGATFYIRLELNRAIINKKK